jgi:hypothetical protein
MTSDRAPTNFSPLIYKSVPLEPISLQFAKKVKEKQTAELYSKIFSNNTSTSSDSVNSSSSSSSSTSTTSSSNTLLSLASASSLSSSLSSIVNNITLLPSLIVVPPAQPKKNRLLAEHNPFHQPSRPHEFTTTSSQPFPYQRWSSLQQAFVGACMSNLRGASLSLMNKYKKVVESWLQKVIDINEPAYNYSQIPTWQEVQKFSEFFGQAQVKQEVNSKKRKRTQTYHSDDDNKNDFYLKVPLTLEMFNEKIYFSKPSS